ncbi:hypothetical protein GQ54DRAFT_315347 [Martensiomyces pterosporus]|nr:hypothetical protein GQ54DRAFT_315347 [Martensiomyces pterosporus]
MSPNITTRVEDIPLGRAYKFMMMPCVPLAGIFLYNVAAYLWERSNEQKAALRRDQASTHSSTSQQKQKQRHPELPGNLKNAIIAHNMVLALYSIWTFVDFFPAVVRNVQAQGLKGGFCDTEWRLWNEKLLMHGFLFYLSKYYEFFDTAIILAKGREAGYLQKFHHSGAVFIMWLGNYVQSPYLAFFVFENSIIHAIMYTYYTLTALGIRPPGKQILTRLQIGQFYVGLSAGFIYALLPDCQSGYQKVFTYWFIPYIIELIRLFNEFAARTYRPKTPAAEKA